MFPFMIYQTYLHSLENHNNKRYSIQIINDYNGDTVAEIKLAGEQPVLITTESDGIFSAVKSRKCTIRIVTDAVLKDIYSPENQGTKIVIQEENNQYPFFEGWLTPCIYNQSYSKVLDELELEFVSCLSTLKNIKYSFINSTPKIQTIQAILYNIFQKTGYSGNILYPINSLDKELTYYKLSEANFIEDDAEATPWSCFEVLEEICKFFGWSCVDYGPDLYLIDYETIMNSASLHKWRKIINSTSSEIVQKNSGFITISKDSYSGSGHTLSYDEVYNKVSVNDSIYELEEISTDIFDTDKNHLINTAGQQMASQRFIHTHKDKEDKAWTIYYTKFLFDSNSNWKCKFFDVSTFQEVDNYFVGEFDYNYAPWDFTNGWGNTIFAMPEKVWVFDEYQQGQTSVDAKEYIAFNVLTYDKASSFSGSITSYKAANEYLNTQAAADLPVLTYTLPEEVQYKAENGYSFICFKGDLWWQCDKDATEVWEDKVKFYVPYPWDGISTMAGEYNKFTRSSSDTDYNKGWPMLRAKLQIGDYYWNGSDWTTTDTTFWINYHKENKSVSSGEDEVLSYGAWQHPVYNTQITVNDVFNTDKAKLIDEDCLAIPINRSLSGKLTFTMYAPKQANVQQSLYDYAVGYKTLCPVVYMKGFELNYKYIPSGYQWHDIDEYDSDSDIIYTNIINENYVMDFDEVELKINTAAENKPVSRSYIMNNNSEYIVNINKNNKNKRQEHNLCNMYYDHYSTQKQIYDCQIHDYLHPGSFVQITALSGNYIVDTQEYDLKLNHNTVKLIEY